MPHYEKRVSTPAGTAKKDAQQRYLTIDSGIIHRVSIRFRHGPNDLCHVKILQGANQIYPTNKRGDYASDGETISFIDHYKIRPGSNWLTIKTWNTGKFSHDIIIRISVMKEEHLNAAASLEKLADRITRLLRLWGWRE